MERKLMKDSNLKAKLFVASVHVENDYSKSMKLESQPGSQVSVTLRKFNIGYEEYLNPIKNYHSKNVGNLEHRLSVVSFESMGPYIRGLFGGDKKHGKETYAGLVLDNISKPNSDIYKIRLYNTTCDLEIQKEEYEKKLYTLLYRGLVHPFYFEKPYSILGDVGKKNLVSSIKHIMAVNGHILGRDDREKIGKLVEEVQFPSKLHTFKKKNWYVVFRINRTFSSVVVFPPNEKWITESHLAFIDCGGNKDKAYYYSGVLNYLAFKATKSHMNFVRDQFSRPVLAIIEAQLNWNRVEPKARLAISDLSYKLHNESENIYYNAELRKEKKAFDLLERNNTFTLLVKKFEEITKESNINDALMWVAGKGLGKMEARNNRIDGNYEGKRTQGQIY
jgi:hypothetical protein